MTDPRTPEQYRGISLLSTISMLFISIINNRLTRYLDDNNLYADEQNGFRGDRNCIDHIFSLTSIIKNRKNRGLSTYIAYIDAEKAFDRVDRDLLLYKLLNIGIGGRMYDIIKNIYTGTSSCINVNGFMTKYFQSINGVRQGDCLSPTLFGIFINDIAEVINNCGAGIPINEGSVSILMYANDIALISEIPDGLQKQLVALHKWCADWRMKINVKKWQVVHYRKNNTLATTFNFHIGSSSINIVKAYK